MTPEFDSCAYRMRGSKKPSKLSCSCCNLTSALPLSITACCILILLTIVTLLRAPVHMEDASYSKRRTILYESMEKNLEEHGTKFLDGGSTSQSLALSDIFKMKDGNVEPILKPADPAVRAIVLYLDPEYADHILEVVKRRVAPFFPKDVWYQDSNVYHSSMFHTSHNHDPVVATPFEISLEAQNVEAVADQSCELSIVLERVVLTSTGVLLGCWQVLSGTDPAVIRSELRKALPRAPAKQLYDEVMLHTSIARFLGPPTNTNSEESPLSVFKKLVSQLNVDLHQYKARIKEMWFVEELDVLALALKGRFKKHRFALRCKEI